jgi:protein phosphatase
MIRSGGAWATCTIIAFDGARIFLGHVGDSRAYLLRNGNLQQLSQDHTLVARMLRAGLLTPDEARTHPQSNVITQSVGARPAIKPDVWRKGLKVARGDRLVVCSDGLHGVVGDDRIKQIAAGAEPRAAAQELIAAARAGGGPDNISVGVFVAAPSSAPATAPECAAVGNRTRPVDRMIEARSHSPF